VLLKQPGAVPAGAGVEGCREELAPWLWQTLQPAALLASVLVWVRPPIFDRHGLGEWGAMTPAPWQPALFRQEVPTLPPAKSVPWQAWQRASPSRPMERDLAEAPWAMGAAHPAGCPEGPLA
jgi:hypothetical protein